MVAGAGIHLVLTEVEQLVQLTLARVHKLHQGNHCLFKGSREPATQKFKFPNLRHGNSLLHSIQDCRCWLKLQHWVHLDGLSYSDEENEVEAPPAGFRVELRGQGGGGPRPKIIFNVIFVECRKTYQMLFTGSKNIDPSRIYRIFKIAKYIQLPCGRALSSRLSQNFKF